MELPCGVRFCANDLVASRDNERAGIVARSLTIVLVLDGDPVHYRLGAADHTLAPGSAAVVAAAADARLSARYGKGHRSRSLVLQATPDAVADDALAEQIDAGLGITAIRPLAAGARLRALADELFASVHAGPAARLLAESCALELLARALLPNPPHPADASMAAGDRVRILQVRDRLLAGLSDDHRLCDLARLAGMSVSSLKAKFPLVVGQSVFDFLRDRRLEHARRGLEHEAWTVKQAAFFAGYAHPSNFATAYRRKFGIAPREARRA